MVRPLVISIDYIEATVIVNYLETGLSLPLARNEVNE